MPDRADTRFWLPAGLLALAADDAVDALALGLATAAVSLLATAIVAGVRRAVPAEARFPLLVLVAATLVAGVDMTLQAALPALHDGIRAALPLAALAAVLMAPAGSASMRAAAAPAGVFVLLVALGLVREGLGAGTLFAGAGERLHWPGLELALGTRGFPPLLIPAGTLLLLAGAAARANARGRRVP